MAEETSQDKKRFDSLLTGLSDKTKEFVMSQIGTEPDISLKEAEGFTVGDVVRNIKDRQLVRITEIYRNHPRHPKQNDDNKGYYVILSTKLNPSAEGGLTMYPANFSNIEHVHTE
jgi:hypothetical protein